jgi:hypothetical protein
MADTGYNWGSWAAMQKGAGDWTSDDITDTSTETGDATSLDGIASMEISIAAVEDNTGAIDGVVNVYVLGDCDGTNYEETNTASYSFSFTPVQNDTVYVRFRLLGSDFSSVKVALNNDAGQTLAMTVKYRTATIPVAS